MSISSEISRITALRNRIKSKLNSLGLLVSNTPSSGNEGGGSNSKAGTSSNAVTGDDLDACADAIESINETTPYLLSSTGAKNVAGYKYAQVDTTVFEPIGSSGSINPNAQNAYIGASGGISTSASSGSVPVSLGQISPSGNYQGMSAVNLLYDSSVIKAENIRSGVSILGIQGNAAPVIVSPTIENLQTNNGKITFNSPKPYNHFISLFVKRNSIPTSSDTVFAFVNTYSYYGHIKDCYFYAYRGTNAEQSLGQIELTISQTALQNGTYDITLESRGSGLGFYGTYLLQFQYIQF